MATTLTPGLGYRQCPWFSCAGLKRGRGRSPTPGRSAAFGANAPGNGFEASRKTLRYVGVQPSLSYDRKRIILIRDEVTEGIVGHCMQI